MKQVVRNSVLVVFSLVFALTSACGKDSSSSKGGTISLKELPLSFEVPAGWKVSRDKVSSSGSPYAALAYKKSDQITVNQDEEVFDNAEAFEQAWLKMNHNVKIVERESFANGFGFTFIESRKGRPDKKMMHYHVKVGDVTYEMESSSIYYDEEHLPAAITIIKSAKARK